MTSLDRSFWTGPRALVADQTAILQIGALCLRDGQDGPEVMMVKSSRGRWIIPKGWPEDGQTDAETAKAEAWEEAFAGQMVLVSTLRFCPLGLYFLETSQGWKAAAVPF